MQKGLKEDLLKILKSYRDLQKFILKADENDLNNFKSDLKFFRGFLKSFKDALKREIESKALSEDLNEDQLEAE